MVVIRLIIEQIAGINTFLGALLVIFPIAILYVLLQLGGENKAWNYLR